VATSSELSLLQQARAFDLQTLGAVYDRYSPLVYRCAYRVLNDVQLSEDCVAEAFGQLLHALGSKGERMHSMESYLMHVALQWIDAYLQRQARPELLSELAYMAHERIEAEDVRWALQEMSFDQRAVLLLKFLEGWDDQQIAAVLDVPTTTLHERYTLALQALNQHLHDIRPEVVL
jgi:RNA polymerase sigma-70 factor, ECF subfamily